MGKANVPTQFVVELDGDWIRDCAGRHARSMDVSYFGKLPTSTHIDIFNTNPDEDPVVHITFVFNEKGIL